MIQPKDLMIGTKVLHDGKHYTILLVGRAAIQAYSDSPDDYTRLDYTQIDGIPLSDQYLTALPEWSSNDWGWSTKIYEDKYLTLLKSMGEFYPQIEELPEISSATMNIVSIGTIKYAHELDRLVEVLK